MCTVTYVPLSNGFCITSNRDEQIARPKAIPPKEYSVNNKIITFPKDKKAGGTWFAQSTEATLVLLNGAAEKHIPKTNYRKSRGLIVLDLIASPDVLTTWSIIELNNIEPFTIILYVNHKLYQLQWNEAVKSTKELDIKVPHIWSSSTLYSKEIRKQREEWFSQFIEDTKILSADQLMDFHQFTENENSDFGLQINRNNILKTVSITQMITSNGVSKIKYIDLLANE
ncbi:NRDE family protein [Flavobacterium jejuense]|uniref:NRDE family protein n=1 Tax=Flavobacterium jejuense TaxID=1544455 RepID=A0ABX0IMT6_9FLAO|nr:NRDE family protein [Flavobacterium jejuense]NHN24906.1 NRDE family protein [Flavobacterium jejuense]